MTGANAKIKRIYVGDNLVRPQVPATAITLNKSSISLTTVGQTSQLTATLTPSGSTSTVSWSSSNTSIATVSSSGLVTCVTPGNCTITAITNNGLTASCSVNKARLPSAYQEVEYIQSSGSSDGKTGPYIDTGFKPNNNSRYVIDFIKTHGYSGPIGCYNNPSSYGFLINNGGPYYGTVAKNDIFNSTTGDRMLCDFNKNQFYYNGTLSYTFTAKTFSMNINTWLFGWNRNGAQSNNYGSQIYSCKIYDNGTLVRDFVPCYRISDNVIGLYDLANNQFYTNQGSGTFSKGGNVN